ncbi:MAG: acetyl-CoA C-acetyltransferase [Polyangiales bacterium]
MNAYIVDAVRTPRGRGKQGKGALSSVHPQELQAQTLQAIVARTGIDPRAIDDVILGCVSQVDEQGANIARNAVLAAGFPIEVSAFSLNRFCASGLQSVTSGAANVASGIADFVIAGGVESMSRVPMGSDRAGQDGGNMRLRERIAQVPQGISADLIATIEGFSREAVDRFALSSQIRAAAAIAENRFTRSIIPVRDEKGRVLLDRDEGPRETTLEALAGLPASFARLGEELDGVALRAFPAVESIRHVHTAGNSSGLADGAAAVAIASADFVRAHGLRPRAKIRAAVTVGSDPVLMLNGPAPASKKALERAGLSASDVDVWEINEAFAAVVLETTRTLGIDPERVNPNGGAIALGHPLGATGAMLLGTAIDELERRNGTFAVVTMCIGGGQGIATVVERVS